MSERRLNILITAKERATGVFQNVTSGLKTVATAGATALAGLTVAVGGVGLKLLQLGSDADEMQSKFATVFGNLAGKTKKQLDELAETIGRSRFELQDMATSFQDTFKPMGFANENAQALSLQMTQLAADLSSFNNIEMDEALRRLQGTLIGSHENALAFGVVINENTLKAELARNGWDELTGAQLEQAKVQARVNLLIAGSTDALGDAERTADGAANQWRAFQASILDSATAAGQELLPVLLPFFAEFATFVKGALPEGVAVFKGFAEDLQGTLGPAILVINDAITRIAKVFGVTANEVTAADAALAALKGVLDALVIAVQAVAVAMNLLATGVEKTNEAVQIAMDLWSQLSTIYQHESFQKIGIAMTALSGGVLQTNAAVKESPGLWDKFKGAVSGFSVPDILKTKSPPPLEIGLRGIADAAREAGLAAEDMARGFAKNVGFEALATEAPSLSTGEDFTEGSRLQFLRRKKLAQQQAEEERQAEADRLKQIEETERARERAAKEAFSAMESAANEMANSISGAVSGAFGRLQEVMPDIFPNPDDQAGEFARRLAALAQGGAAGFDQAWAEAFTNQAGGNPIFAGLLQSLESGDSAAISEEANRLLSENMAQVIAVGLADSIRSQMEQQNLLEEAQRIVAEQLGEAPITEQVGVVPMLLGDTTAAAKDVETGLDQIGISGTESFETLKSGAEELLPPIQLITERFENWLVLLGSAKSHFDQIRDAANGAGVPGPGAAAAAAEGPDVRL